MHLIESPTELDANGHKSCMAIGFFDGVHLGHQQIIRQAVADARQREGRSLVVTFDRHPNTVVAPQRVPPLIYSQPQRLRAIEALGVDVLLLLRFDKDFSRQSGDAFIRELAGNPVRIQSLSVGKNFTFGYKRGGDVALLMKLGQELGFAVHGLAAVSLDGKLISSTRIREAIRAGQLDLAGQMLGRPYSLAANVSPGDSLGRKLGFPTANLDVAGLAVPPNGVYAAQAIVRGKSWRAAVNIGFRPTLGDPQPQLRVEAHLLDLDTDLYSEEVEIVFLERLRDEKKFGSVEELREQIARDVDRVRARF